MFYVTFVLRRGGFYTYLICGWKPGVDCYNCSHMNLHRVMWTLSLSCHCHVTVTVTVTVMSLSWHCHDTVIYCQGACVCSFPHVAVTVVCCCSPAHHAVLSCWSYVLKFPPPPPCCWCSVLGLSHVDLVELYINMYMNYTYNMYTWQLPWLLWHYCGLPTVLFCPRRQNSLCGKHWWGTNRNNSLRRTGCSNCSSSSSNSSNSISNNNTSCSWSSNILKDRDNNNNNSCMNIASMCNNSTCNISSSCNTINSCNNNNSSSCNNKTNNSSCNNNNSSYNRWRQRLSGARHQRPLPLTCPSTCPLHWPPVSTQCSPLCHLSLLLSRVTRQLSLQVTRVSQWCHDPVSRRSQTHQCQPVKWKWKWTVTVSPASQWWCRLQRHLSADTGTSRWGRRVWSVHCNHTCPDY